MRYAAGRGIVATSESLDQPRLANHTEAVEIVNVLEAKTQLSRLLARVEKGEEIVIGRGGKPVARLVRYADPEKRELGFLKDLLGPVPDTFFDPLPEEELRLWEGADDETAP